jgi:hypothetical protein
MRASAHLDFFAFSNLWVDDNSEDEEGETDQMCAAYL